jgi:general secretion pathway protein D
MKKLTLVLSIVILGFTSLAAQDEPQSQQEVVQTPFGQQPLAEQPAQPVAAPVAGEAPPAGEIAAAAPGQQAAQIEDEIVPIQLFLDNQDIYQIIQIIGDELGINYIVDPLVRGTVNINTAGTLFRSDLLPILETILRINGATIVQTGNFYEILPANNVLRTRLRVQDDPQTPSPDDQFVIQIVRMSFVAASEMSQLLTPYMSEGANIVVHEGGNILLVTERRRNLEKLLEIVDIFDTNVFEGERVRLFPIENNLATDMVNDLDTVFSGYALSQASAIRFVAIERLNSILVVSPNAAVFEEVGNWLERLDQPSAGIQNFVYKVQNAKASDIQAVLSQLYGTQDQISNLVQASAGSTGVAGQPATTTVGAAGGLGAAGGFVPVSDIRIIADVINNALVIQASAQEYAAIEATIRQLDVSPRQVLIDAQIYEVVLDDSIAFGLSAILQNRGTLANPQTTASFAGAPPSFSAQTFAFIGRSRELLGFLNASENRSRVRTLSAPSVMVSDNMSAAFQVGAEVPVPTSSSVTPVQSDGTNLFAQTIQFRPTGVILNVTPQINDGGNVTLEISQEVSQAGANTTSGVVAPVISTASVQSTVVVRDGQTIAIAGFIQENNDLIRNRVPILGRIPGLGVLFGSTSRSNTRTELVVLITPHVIRNTEDADLATDELMDKLREIQEMLD